MDKRIIKTKKNIKKTLVSLLKIYSFEKITISEICRVGEIGRITFYTYYEDKYALIDDIFYDLWLEADADYKNMQGLNNPTKIPQKSYHNMLCCVLNLYDTNMDFLQYVAPEKNPYLYSSFSQEVFKYISKYVKQHEEVLPLRYPSGLVTSLMCNGIWGVINECNSLNYPFNKTREIALNMFHDLIISALMEKRN